MDNDMIISLDEPSFYQDIFIIKYWIKKDLKVQIFRKTSMFLKIYIGLGSAPSTENNEFGAS